MGNAVLFRVLGPVEPVAARPIAMRALKIRSLLALLLLDPGRSAGRDWLVDQLWHGSPPKGAPTTLRAYAHRLRKVLEPLGGAAVLRSSGNGYLLEADPDGVDAHRFAFHVEAGRRALTLKRVTDAVGALRAGLDLWHGESSFADVDVPAVRDRARHLDGLRLEAAEQHLEAALESDLAPAMTELESLARAHPLHEGFSRLLMLGLYRAGRPSEALLAYQRLHHVLDDELGIRPSAAVTELHRRILDGDPQLQPDLRLTGRAPRLTPRQLPSAPAHFTGRDPQLAELDRLLASGGTAAVVTGPAGIGKTAFALHWAHRAADRFPDGQLYVDLRGFGSAGHPLTPADALRSLLDALGAPPAIFAADLEVQAAYYRTRLADKRVLVLLDNARDAEQVRPLLPGVSLGLTLVTGRDRCSALVVQGAQPIALDYLDPDEARRLLSGRLHPDRTAAEPEAAQQIADACAGLPLALAIAAGRAASRPAFPLAVLADELRGARRDPGRIACRTRADRLEAFTDPDPDTDLRSVFSWSYDGLDPAAARLFRLLSIHTGPSFDAPAAAAAADAPSARRLLSDLERVGLLAEPEPGRFAFHDLLHAYAEGLPDRGRADAERRLLDHYLGAATAANGLLDPFRALTDPGPTPPGPLPFADRADAEAWLAAEEPVLLRMVETAARRGFDEHCWRLARALHEFLHRRGRRCDQTAMWRTAIEAAERLGDPVARTASYRLAAQVHSCTGRFAESRRLLDAALALGPDLDDRVDLAETHLVYAQLRRAEGHFAASIESAGLAFGRFCAAGHAAGQARALNAMGWGHSLAGDQEAALERSRSALALARAVGDRPGQADALDVLGRAHHYLGRFDRAARYFRRAADQYRALGSRSGEARVLVRLADSLSAGREYAAVQGACRRALSILEELGLPDAQAVEARLHRSETALREGGPRVLC